MNIYFWLVQRPLYSVHHAKVRRQEMKYYTMRKVVNCPVLAAIVVAKVLIVTLRTTETNRKDSGEKDTKNQSYQSRPHAMTR